MILILYKKVRKIISIIFLFLVIVVNTFPQEMALPVSTQIQIFQKVLSFNRSKIVNNPIILGVIYQSKFRTSLNTAIEIEKYFQQNEVKVSGHLIKIQLIDILNEDLASAIHLYTPTYVYIAPLKGYDIVSIHKLLAPLNILTLSGLPQYAEDFNISVSIGINAGQPQIILNRKSYMEEGADFSSHLLKLKLVKIIE